MKYLIIMLAIVTSQCFAGVNDEAIAEVKAQIAQLEKIENPNRDTKMALWRLRNRLKQLEDFNI